MSVPPIKYPPWLPPPAPRDELLRAANGLIPKIDGWYKSVAGRTRYVCKPMPVREVVALLPRRVAAIRDRLAGTPRPAVVTAGPGLTRAGLVAVFRAAMLKRVAEGVPKPMAQRTYDDYCDVLTRFLAAAGADGPADTTGPAEFSAFAGTLAGRAASTRRREIQYVDRLFNWAGPCPRAMNLIPYCRRGPDWVKPGDDEVTGDGDKAYTPEQVRAVFAAVADSPPLWLAAVLGFACAFIPRDVATVPEALVERESATIRFARGKNRVGRLCWLPPAGVAALDRYLAYRDRMTTAPRPAAAGLLFRTREGMPYARRYVTRGGRAIDDNLLAAQWTERVGLPYTGLRSAFATLADEWPDERAIDVVMGHKVGRTGRHVRRLHYAKRFSPERVQRLVAHVWLQVFPNLDEPRPPSPGT